MKRRVRLLSAGIAVVFAGMIGLGADRAEVTQAAWTSTQHAAGSASAATLVAPTITSCTTTSTLGVFSGVTIVWTSSAPLETTTQAVYFGSALGTQAPTRTGGANGVYTYSVTYSSGVLTSLVSGLLGGSTTISVRVRSGTDWASPAATRTLTVALAGLNPRCT